MEKESGSAFYLPIAVIYQKLDKHNEAIETCREGLKFYENHTQLQVVLAESLARMGNKDEAIDVLADILVSDEDNYKALKILGWIHKDSENNTEAGKYLQAAYMKAPEDEDLLIWLEDLGISPNAYKEPERATFIEDEEDAFNDDELNYNVEQHVTEAYAAIAALMKELASFMDGGGGAATAAPVEDDGRADLAPTTAEAEYIPEPVVEATPEVKPTSDEDIFEQALKQFDEIATQNVQEPAPTLLKGDKATPFIPSDLVDSVYQESGLDPDDPFGDEPINVKKL